MTRVVKDIPTHALKGTILLLPPLGSGFQNYEVSEDGDYDNSFAAYYASRNFDVWGYSQRVQGLAAGSCESGVIDCAVIFLLGHTQGRSPRPMKPKESESYSGFFQRLGLKLL